ncbi:hypothetical protein ABNX05_13295 [Lysinibacillus sp. M3]|uniref:Uncharacterized protein n=1 Tax=Lysinibacillus zambalensis TaxID=3160866 RepID=A0ABV1MSW5_9BACI
MGKLWMFFALAVIYIIRIVLGFLSGVYLLDGTTALDTEKIDNNMFNELYEHEERHRSFFVNIKVNEPRLDNLQKRIISKCGFYRRFNNEKSRSDGQVFGLLWKKN